MYGKEHGMNLTAIRWQEAAIFPRAHHRREPVNPKPLEELRDTSSPSQIKSTNVDRSKHRFSIFLSSIYSALGSDSHLPEERGKNTGAWLDIPGSSSIRVQFCIVWGQRTERREKKVTHQHWFLILLDRSICDCVQPFGKTHHLC